MCKLKSKKLSLVLVFSAILCSSLFGYQYALSTVPASGPYYLDIPFGTASYYIGKFDNGSTYMVNGDTWQCTWNDPDSSAVLNACVSNLTTGGTIYIKSPFYADGELVITESNITIKTDTFPNSATTTGVNIDRIKIDSTSNAIRGVTFEGIFFYQIWFYQASSNTIENIYFYRCQIQASAGVYSEGIIFDGDDTASIHNIYFNDCYFYDRGQSVRAGFISFTNVNAGMGQIYFNNCHYDTYGSAGNYVFMAYEDGGIVGTDVDISNSDFIATAGGTSWTFLKLMNQSLYAGTGIYSMKVHHNWFEIHANTTLFSIEASTQLTNFVVIADGNTISDAVGTITTIINNLNSNWQAYNQGLSFHNNWVLGYGTVNIGTPATSTYFDVPILDNRGIVTENSVTFSSISNGTYVAHGCVGTPDYVTITLSTQGYGWYGTKNSTHCQLYFSTASASGTVKFEYEP